MGLTSTTFAQQCAGQILFYTFASSSAVLNASTLYYSTTRCTSRRLVRLLHFPLGRHIFPFPTKFFRAWYLRCFKENLAPHMTARYAARRACWRRASFVAGIFFISLSFCVSKVCLVLFTLSSGICLSYIRMTNLSIVGRIPSMCAAVGVWTSVRRVHLTSSNLFYTDHAVRFPLPADFAKWLLM